MVPICQLPAAPQWLLQPSDTQHVQQHCTGEQDFLRGLKASVRCKQDTDTATSCPRAVAPAADMCGFRHAKLSTLQRMFAMQYSVIGVDISMSTFCYFHTAAGQAIFCVLVRQHVALSC
jgi:hypothetical protein